MTTAVEDPHESLGGVPPEDGGEKSYTPAGPPTIHMLVTRRPLLTILCTLETGDPVAIDNLIQNGFIRFADDMKQVDCDECISANQDERAALRAAIGWEVPTPDEPRLEYDHEAFERRKTQIVGALRGYKPEPISRPTEDEIDWTKTPHKFQFSHNARECQRCGLLTHDWIEASWPKGWFSDLTKIQPVYKRLDDSHERIEPVTPPPDEPLDPSLVMHIYGGMVGALCGERAFGRTTQHLGRLLENITCDKCRAKYLRFHSEVSGE